MTDRNTVAEALYTTYCAAVGGIAFNGDPLPTWSDFAANPNNQKQTDAWLEVADEVAVKMINLFLKPNAPHPLVGKAS